MYTICIQNQWSCKKKKFYKKKQPEVKLRHVPFNYIISNSHEYLKKKYLSVFTNISKPKSIFKDHELFVKMDDMPNPVSLNELFS